MVIFCQVFRRFLDTFCQFFAHVVRTSVIKALFPCMTYHSLRQVRTSNQATPTFLTASCMLRLKAGKIVSGDSMRIDILCLFPDMFTSPLEQSIIKRAREQGIIDIVVHNIRDHAHDKHHTVDDYPYGGGPGMVMKPECVFEAVESIKQQLDSDEIPTILLSPQGKLLTQQVARELALQPNLMLICGHYEGIDERVCEHLVTDEISIGDYVLSNGELAAMVLVDAVARLIPGVLGSPLSTDSDSHSDGLLEYPQYTRPQVYRGWSVPSVLLSGNHSEIARWRRCQAILRTARRRPDLIERLTFVDKEKEWISESSLSPR